MFLAKILHVTYITFLFVSEFSGLNIGKNSKGYMWSSTSRISCFLYIILNIIIPSTAVSLDVGIMLRSFSIIGYWKSSPLNTGTNFACSISLHSTYEHTICFWDTL